MIKEMFVAGISVILGILLSLSFQWKSCSYIPKEIQIDTLQSIKIIPRDVFITDTIKVKAVSWKTRDSLIFVDKEIPCNDTNFVAQSDSIIVPTGDTLNLAFNYQDRRGTFSLVYKPRPDSIIVKEILKPFEKESEYPYSHILGAIGVGIMIGVYSMSK